MIIVLTFINLQIGLKVFLDPTPFPSSYWDIRWAFAFGFSFLIIGLLFIFSQEKILFFISFIGLAFSILLPIFTINSGPAFLMFFLISIISIGVGESILFFFTGKTIVDKYLVFLFSILIGLGIIMILVMIQGFLNAFTPLITWIGLAFLFIVFVIPKIMKWLYTIRDIFYQIITSLKNSGQFPLFALVLGIFVVLWVPSWFIALSPPMRYDEMTYHLSAPLLYLERGGIVVYPEGGMTVWMHYAEMLYTLAIQTAGLTLPRIFHFFMGGMSVLVTFLFGRRLFGNKTGLIAAVLLFSVPVLGYESATAYIDFFVTAYTAAVGLAFLLYWQEKNPRWLLVAGFLGGIGLGVKLTAGPMLFVMLVFLLLLMLSNKKNKVELGWFFLCVFMILILALPWLIRDTIWTGDPFYPYGKMFLERISQSSNTSTGIVESGLIARLSKYIIYPIELVFNSIRYYHEAPGGMASILPLMAIPVFVFSTFISKQKKIIGLILLLSSIITVWLMILINSALLRYALPIFPWLAICAAMNIVSVFQHFQFRKRTVFPIILLFTGLIYLFSTRLPLIVKIYDNLPQRFPINFVLGRETREEYLSRNLVVYDAYQFIDAQENGPHRVLSIGNEFRLYSQSRIDGIYDVGSAHNIVSSAKSIEELSNSLDQSGYDYILVNQPEIDYRPWKYEDAYPILKGLDFYDAYGELVYARKGIYVYHLVPGGVVLSPQIIY